jgi:hypothetical protein
MNRILVKNSHRKKLRCLNFLLKTIVKSNFFKSIQGKAFMQTIKKNCSSKRKFHAKVCSHRLLRSELSPDHGYVLYKWLCDMIHVYDNICPVLMGGKVTLNRRLRVISPQYDMNGSKTFYDARLHDSDYKHDGSECLRKTITV